MNGNTTVPYLITFKDYQIVALLFWSGAIVLIEITLTAPVSLLDFLMGPKSLLQCEAQNGNNEDISQLY